MPESSDDATSGKFQQPIETLLEIYKRSYLLLANLLLIDTTADLLHASFSTNFKTSTQTHSSHTNTETQDVSLPKIVHHRRPYILLPAPLPHVGRIRSIQSPR
jgi:hypothetical protein